MFKKFDIKYLFLPALILLTIISSYHLYKMLDKTHRMRELLPYSFVGFKFAGLGQFISGSTHIGYYTDRSLDESNPAAHFAQAQYVLTPVVLDLDFQKHQYVIFDCSTDTVAMKKMKEIGAKPLKRNQFGIILAEKK